MDGNLLIVTQFTEEIELDEIRERHRKQMNETSEKEKAGRQEDDLVPRRLASQLSRLNGSPKEVDVVTYRVAIEADLAELAAMRWQFRLEEAPGTLVHDRASFLSACEAFLQQGLREGRWTYWIAEADGGIVSQIFVQRVAKVPKPNRLEASVGYMTNVYTRPGYRNRGIGTQLVRRVLQWAHEQDLERLIVWPSAASLHFYERAGFRGGSEILECEVRPYVA